MENVSFTVYTVQVVPFSLACFNKYIMKKKKQLNFGEQWFDFVIMYMFGMIHYSLCCAA